MNITDFITARLDDDEQAAKAATAAPWNLRLHESDDKIVTESGHWLVYGASYEEVVLEVDEDDLWHMSRHDPARVLREVQAKRVILAEHEDNEGQCARCLDDDGVWVDGGRTIAYAQPWPCRTIRALANVYVDHPDFVAEWKL